MNLRAIRDLELPISLPGEVVSPRPERDDPFERSLYFDPHGQPITGTTSEQTAQWATHRESRKWDHKTSLWLDEHPVNVSTVYLGIDHSFSAGSVPIIYETMIFADFSWMDEACWRYATPSAAMDGHRRVVEALVEAGAVVIDAWAGKASEA